jgi:AMIN domain-containing protein
MQSAFSQKKETVNLQSTAPAPVVRKLEVMPLKEGGIDIGIVCTRPVVPILRRLKDPERLVVELPNTLVSTDRQLIPVQSPDVRALHVELQESPVVTRITFDLAGARDYSLDAQEDRLIIHVKGVAGTNAAAQSPAPNPATTGVRPATVAAPPTRPSRPPVTASVPSGATATVQERRPLPVPPPQSVVTTGPGASVFLSGTRVAPGSSLTAGGETALLRLARGGEVRVCPGTTVSVTPSKSGRDLMLGMNGGAMELHYNLGGAADTVLTPDFRILVPGPGEIHYAISADAKGNTCVRALPLNTVSAIVSELLGTGSYRLKTGEQMVFHDGRLDHMDNAVPTDCGCPPPLPAVLRASQQATPPTGTTAGQAVAAAPPQALSSSTVRSNGGGSSGAVEFRPAPASGQLQAAGNAPQLGMVAGSPEQPLPPSSQNLHVQVDAPFVFRAEAEVADVSGEVRQLPIARNVDVPSENQVVAPPAQPAPKPAAALAEQGQRKSKQPSAGFFGKVKGFFSSIFK